jgi:hypothetical protein
VLIGVKKTGNLPELASVGQGVQWMADWLKSQHVPDDRISVITDESGPVSLDMIKRAVKTQLKDDVEQIIVYFSGHGLFLRGGEYWLLTDAPDDPQAAVNLDGSVALARLCRVPHVVFISDACRTAGEGVQAQNISGGEIFPNPRDTECEAPVDIFFASALGKPSLEIGYTSAFTKALVSALNGEQPAVLEHAEEDNQTIGIVRPRPLGNFLKNELPKMLLAAKITTYTQVPFARYGSEPEAWLSKVPLSGDNSRRLRAGGKPPKLTPPNLDSTVQRLLIESQPVSRLPDASATFAGAQELRDAVARNLESFGPDHFESQCGFKVRGATISYALSSEVPLFVVDEQRTLVRAEPQHGARLAMLAFGDGSSVMLPAIPGYVCALLFTDGELTDVAYDPSSNTPLGMEDPAALQSVRELRSVIISSAQLGVFRLDQKSARDIAARISRNRLYDPTIAIFAAYAFTDLRMRQDLLDMYIALRDATHVRLFDVAMLARQLNDPMNITLSCGRFPLLAQGWSLLNAYGVAMSGLLSDLQKHLKPALWTSFDAAGSEILRRAVTEGLVR